MAGKDTEEKDGGNGRKTPPSASVIIKQEKLSPTHSVKSSASRSSKKGGGKNGDGDKHSSAKKHENGEKKHTSKSDKKGTDSAGSSGASKSGASDNLPALKRVKVDKTTFATGSLAERMRQASGVGEPDKSQQRIIRRACVPQPTGKNKNPWYV